ncbi:hypothetical protein MFLO_01065 [Listeria floridensis FSL S10-1187]|uniref:Uncharacterized protein n=1 Tax=Listeria floridensis FSL S10-1187 TaxID=1265817 RepID=A0ABP3B3K9_9LIST|nr:hypothetical protein MFLO_01065 [Listeria floridensis FSL S10-1187]
MLIVKGRKPVLAGVHAKELDRFSETAHVPLPQTEVLVENGRYKLLEGLGQRVFFC